MYVKENHKTVSRHIAKTRQLQVQLRHWQYSQHKQCSLLFTSSCVRIHLTVFSAWTQSMALRWPSGCRSRKLCLGNVCLRHWTVPRVHLNWAPCYNLQAHIWSLCCLDGGRREVKKKEKKDHPSSRAFSFVSVIAIDFCLTSPTLWQTQKSKSLKFSVKVKWGIVTSRWMEVGPSFVSRNPCEFVDLC